MSTGIRQGIERQNVELWPKSNCHLFHTISHPLAELFVLLLFAKANNNNKICCHNMWWTNPTTHSDLLDFESVDMSMMTMIMRPLLPQSMPHCKYIHAVIRLTTITDIANQYQQVVISFSCFGLPCLASLYHSLSWYWSDIATMSPWLSHHTESSRNFLFWFRTVTATWLIVSGCHVFRLFDGNAMVMTVAVAVGETVDLFLCGPEHWLIFDEY